MPAWVVFVMRTHVCRRLSAPHLRDAHPVWSSPFWFLTFCRNGAPDPACRVGPWARSVPLHASWGPNLCAWMTSECVCVLVRGAGSVRGSAWLGLGWGVEAGEGAVARAERGVEFWRNVYQTRREPRGTAPRAGRENRTASLPRWPRIWGAVLGAPSPSSASLRGPFKTGLVLSSQS